MTAPPKINRRRFKRIALNEDAIVVDSTGRKLGCVSQASGSGMLVSTPSAATMQGLSLGEQLRVTVIEPKSKNQHTIDIIVRYMEEDKLGVEFVTGPQFLSL